MKCVIEQRSTISYWNRTTKRYIRRTFSIVCWTCDRLPSNDQSILSFLAMNVSISALERLLHRYTMESTSKPFDVRSVPVEAVPVERPNGNIHGELDSNLCSSLHRNEHGSRYLAWSNGHDNQGWKYVQWFVRSFDIDLRTFDSFRKTLGYSRVRAFGSDLQNVCPCRSYGEWNGICRSMHQTRF